MSEKAFKNYLNRYEFEYTLPGTGETVKFKPLTTNQMKQLLEYEDESDLGKMSEAMDKLMKSSIVTEDFDTDELYLRDRFSLLLQIRKKTKGETYQFQFTCPKCKSQVLNSVNLDELEEKKLETKTGEVEVADGVTIEIEHIKRKDEKEALENIDLNKAQNDREREFEYWTSLLAVSIKSVTTPDGKDEDLTFEDKKFIIENTTQAALENIGNWFNENWFGTNFEFEMKCDTCDYSAKQQVPMNQLFS